MPVIMFSRQFPAYHPRAGEPTYFVEKLLQSFVSLNLPGYYTDHIKRLRDLKYLDISKMVLDPMDKFHTVRAGHRFNPGDKFSPRVWMGKPYRSEQLILGPDVEVKKTWNFEVDQCGVCSLSNQYVYDYGIDGIGVLDTVAANDGLSTHDFEGWIVQPAYRQAKAFDGQVICWNDKIEYP